MTNKEIIEEVKNLLNTLDIGETSRNEIFQRLEDNGNRGKTLGDYSLFVENVRKYSKETDNLKKARICFKTNRN